MGNQTYKNNWMSSDIKIIHPSETTQWRTTDRACALHLALSRTVNVRNKIIGCVRCAEDKKWIYHCMQLCSVKADNSLNMKYSNLLLIIITQCDISNRSNFKAREKNLDLMYRQFCLKNVPTLLICTQNSAPKCTGLYEMYRKCSPK